MTLAEYILTYERDEKIVCNLFDYYEIFIKGLDPKFKQYSYYATKLVLCYFKDHADINPSMGFIRSKRHGSKVIVCHCLGCGRTADVVRLHQILSSQWLDKELTEKEACEELALMFDIPLDDYDELGDEDYEEKYHRNRKRINILSKRYTKRDFTQDLMSIRTEGSGKELDLNKLNSACVKIIATTKDLYN